MKDRNYLAMLMLARVASSFEVFVQKLLRNGHGKPDTLTAKGYPRKLNVIHEGGGTEETHGISPNGRCGFVTGQLP